MPDEPQLLCVLDAGSLQLRGSKILHTEAFIGMMNTTKEAGDVGDGKAEAIR